METPRMLATREELSRLTKVKLQILCRQLEVPVKGNKKDVVERLLLRQAEQGSASRLAFFLEELASQPRPESGFSGDGENCAFARRRGLPPGAVNSSPAGCSVSSGLSSHSPHAFGARPRLNDPQHVYANFGSLQQPLLPQHANLQQQQPHHSHSHQHLHHPHGFHPSPHQSPHGLNVGLGGRPEMNGPQPENMSNNPPTSVAPPASRRIQNASLPTGSRGSNESGFSGARTRSSHAVARNAMASSQPQRCYCQGRPTSALGQADSLLCISCQICGTKVHAACYGVSSGAGFCCGPCHLKEMDPFAPVVETLFFTRLDQKDYTFDLDATDLKKWRTEGKDVFIRCFEPSTKVHLQTWPWSCNIKINGRVEEAVQAPSWEHKRRDTPIVITQYLRTGSNKIQFCWEKEANSSTTFFMGILLCGLETPETIQASVTARASLGESECKERVSRILNASQEEAGDAEVLCLEVGRRLKLLCPITFVKIETPCRGRKCAHLQCYDLEGYVTVNKQTKAFNSRWRCPQCHLHVLPRDLVVDAFFDNILKTTDFEDQEVELQADLTFRVIPEEELKALSKRAEAQRLQAEALLHPQGATPENRGASQPAVEDVVIDSDEDDGEEAKTGDAGAEATDAAESNCQREAESQQRGSGTGSGEEETTTRVVFQNSDTELFGAEDEEYEAEGSAGEEAADDDDKVAQPKRRRLLKIGEQQQQHFQQQQHQQQHFQQHQHQQQEGGGEVGSERLPSLEASSSESIAPQDRVQSPSQTGYSSGQEVLVILSDDDDEDSFEASFNSESFDGLAPKEAVSASQVPRGCLANSVLPNQQTNPATADVPHNGVSSAGSSSSSSSCSFSSPSAKLRVFEGEGPVQTSNRETAASVISLTDSDEDEVDALGRKAEASSPSSSSSSSSHNSLETAKVPRPVPPERSTGGEASSVVGSSSPSSTSNAANLPSASERQDGGEGNISQLVMMENVVGDRERDTEMERAAGGEAVAGQTSASSSVSSLPSFAISTATDTSLLSRMEEDCPDPDTLRAILDERAGIPPLDDPNYRLGSRCTSRGRSHRSFCSSTNVPAPIPRHCPNYSQRLLAASMPRSAYLFHSQTSAVNPPPSPAERSGVGLVRPTRSYGGTLQLGRRGRPLGGLASVDAQRKAAELHQHLLLRNHQVLLHQQRLLQQAQQQQQRAQQQQVLQQQQPHPHHQQQQQAPPSSSADTGSANAASANASQFPAVYSTLRLQLQSQVAEQQLQLLNQQRQIIMQHQQQHQQQQQPPPQSHNQ